MGRSDPPLPSGGPVAHFQYSRSSRDRFWALFFLLTWLAVIAAGAYGVAHRWAACLSLVDQPTPAPSPRAGRSSR